MLSDTLYRVRRIDGLQNLQRRGGEGGAKELTSSRLRLPATGTHRYQVASEESVIVLQEGREVGRLNGPPETGSIEAALVKVLQRAGG